MSLTTLSFRFWKLVEFFESLKFVEFCSSESCWVNLMFKCDPRIFYNFHLCFESFFNLSQTGVLWIFFIQFQCRASLTEHHRWRCPNNSKRLVVDVWVLDGVSLPHPWSFYRQLPFTATSSGNIYIDPGNTWASSTQVIYIFKILKENNESDKMFGHISFVEMKFSQLIN
jgi:hypothetical protein